MRKHFTFGKALVALIMVSLVAVSCDRDDVDKPNGELTFRLYDADENAIEGTQSILFGDSKEYVLKSTYVTSMSIAAPIGWTVGFYPDAEKAIITAPDASDLTAELSGEVKVVAGGPADQTLTFTMNVAAVEAGIEFNFIDQMPEILEFQLGETITYTATVSNVSDLEITVPDGWTYVLDMEVSPITIAFTAPEEEEDGDMTGTIKILPKSVRGTVGTETSFDVNVIVEFPTITLDADYLEFTDFSQTKDIAFTSQYVETITAENLPEGWSLTVDVAESKISITSQAADAGELTGSGTIIFTAASDMGYLTTVELLVYINIADAGISTAEEFVAFGEAVTNGTTLLGYMRDGEVILLDDIDLSAVTANFVVGDAENPFKNAFNGNGKTITIKADEINVSEWGLFHTLAEGATIRNVNVEGSLISIFSPTVASPASHHVSGLVIYNDGGTIRDVTTNVDFTYNPAAYMHYHRILTTATSNQVYSYDYAASYGSATARVTGSTAVYSNCVSNGTLYMQNGAFTHGGNLVGRISTDGVTVTECVNNGELKLAFGDNSAEGTKYGGIVGDADNYSVTFTGCKNYGEINITFGVASTNLVFAVGGIVGSTYGTITGCYNYGEFNTTERAADRRYGGIVGCVGFHVRDAIGGGLGDSAKSFYMTDCHNEADFTHCSNMTGGVAGIIERCIIAEVKNCTNKGTIEGTLGTATASGHSSHTMGGIAGQFRGTLMQDCTNYGKITGYNRLHVGGVVGRGQSYNSEAAKAIQMVRCKNEGDIDVITQFPTTDASNYLNVSGIITVQNGVWNFVECSNTGILTPTMETKDKCRNICAARAGTLTFDASSQAEQNDQSAPRINPTIY